MNLLAKLTDLIEEKQKEYPINYHVKTTWGGGNNITLYLGTDTINNVAGQYVAKVSLYLGEDLEFKAWSRAVHRKPRRYLDSEKYLAMKGEKVPFRTPKKDEKAIERAMARFLDRYIDTIKTIVANNEQLHEDLVNYDKFRRNN